MPGEVHPVFLPEDTLFEQCETTRQRRSGPGGQHRNKVETAIRLLHVPTGISTQASERRSQAENLKVAKERLRLELALGYRSTKPGDEPVPSELWKSRNRGKQIAINPNHADFALLLAEILDALQASDWDHKQVAERFSVSGSQLLKFLKKEPRAFAQLNLARQDRGLKPLS